ncbi:hypothetical protein MUU54_22630 [Rhizobium tarimense]|nr:hypothetical protein [Pseudorhizobium tarimense]MCJ8521551.1 hypothetical protein [Pseudorhizobium tarimense]
MVVDGCASLRCALVGDVIAELGRRNGWHGVVINGAIETALSSVAWISASSHSVGRPKRAARQAMDN